MQSICKLSFVCLCSLLMFSGCDTGPDVASIVGENNKTNIQKVANAMTLYQKRLGKAVPNEEELCDFIETNSTIERNLDFMKIDRASFKDYLISERDNQPFFIRYGVFVPDRTPAQAFVFETVGLEGARQIGWSDSTVQDVTEEKEYAKLKSGKVKKSSRKTVDPSLEASKAAAKAAEAAK